MKRIQEKRSVLFLFVSKKKGDLTFDFKKGTYGIVYKAISNETEQVVAIKKIKLENPEEGIPATAIVCKPNNNFPSNIKRSHSPFFLSLLLSSLLTFFGS